MHFAPFSLVFLLFLFTVDARSVGLGPGRRALSCTATYNNVLYVWGGVLDPSIPSANFTSTTFPLKKSSITWTDLSWDIPPNLANKSNHIDVWPCVVSPKGILVVGGVNLFGYDLIANKYVAINASGGDPLKVLESRTNVRAIQVDDSVYYFGGYLVSGTFPNETALAETDLFVLNLTTWAWEVRAVNNPTSIPPHYDSSTLVYGENGSIYMFGGSRGTGLSMAIYYSNIYRFDISSATWSQITVSPGAWPNGFDNSAGAMLGTTIYLFGGGSSKTGAGLSTGGLTTTYFINDTNVFGTNTGVSSTLQVPVSPNAPKLGSIIGYAGIQMDTAILVGGLTGYPVAYLGDIFIFNSTSASWVSEAGAGPSIQTQVSQTSTAVSASVSASASASASGTPFSTLSNLSKAGVIAGSAVAGVAVLAAVVAVFVVRRVRRKRSYASTERDRVRAATFHKYPSKYEDEGSKDAVEYKPNRMDDIPNRASFQ